jgi:hypothetical protein
MFMNYFGAYRFAFESPKWAIHLLIGTVCQFVPIVGPFVLMGYIYSVIEAKLRHGRDQFPDFDFNQLSAYLVRGIWPFLVSLVTALPMIFLMIPAFLIFAIGAAASADQRDGPPWFAIILFIGWMLVGAIVMFAIQIVAVPMLLRAGLSQDFASAFSMSYIRDFLSRVWKELILSLLFMWVTAPFVLLGGLLLLFVGIYPATVVMLFAQFHFHYQLYELYLQRGGTPIPFKEPPQG